MCYTRFYRKDVVCIELKYDSLDRVYFVSCYDIKQGRITEKDFKTEYTAYNYYIVLLTNWLNKIAQNIPREDDESDIEKFAKYLDELRKETPELTPDELNEVWNEYNKE